MSRTGEGRARVSPGAKARYGERMGRVKQLDGLRGIAILLVVFAHAWNGVRPEFRRLVPQSNNISGGGLFGVQLFFVLSGFLITGILLRERERSGTISLRSFYNRRAHRLLPALFTVGAVYLVWAAHGDATNGAVGSVLRAVTYTENLDPLIGFVPSDGWLGHTWSLAVEEQFYLVWPLLLLFGFRWGRKGVMVVATAGIAAALVSRVLLERKGVRTDELIHWDALMVGCLLACRPVRVHRYLGWAAFSLMFGAALYVPNFNQWMWLASIPICAIALVHALETNWLKSRVLVYFGAISYGLYLWHALLLRPGWNVVFTVALSVAVADLSFRYIEKPFLRKKMRVEQHPAPDPPREQPLAPTAVVAEQEGAT